MQTFHSVFDRISRQIVGWHKVGEITFTSLEVVQMKSFRVEQSRREAQAFHLIGRCYNKLQVHGFHSISSGKPSEAAERDTNADPLEFALCASLVLQKRKMRFRRWPLKVNCSLVPSERM